MIPSMSPFQRVLGEAFDKLPAPLRRLHGLDGPLTTHGMADVTSPPGLGPWLLCKLSGLPKPGCDIPVTVRFEPDGKGRELWRRTFAKRRYVSVLGTGKYHDELVLDEFFGPFHIFFRLIPTERDLTWVFVNWRFLGLPLPSWTFPTIRCTESGEQDKFIFDVEAAFPVIGPTIHYRGWLATKD